MCGPYRRGRMKRVTLTSALTIAGVLSAGATAALVNTRVLENAGGDATGTNRVALEEARDATFAWSRLPVGVPRPSTSTTTPPVTALGGESGSDADDASSAGPTTSDVVGVLDDAERDEPTRPTPRPSAPVSTGTTPATTSTSEPPPSSAPTTSAAPTTTPPSPPSVSSTTTTAPHDDSRNDHLDWSHWFPGPTTTTTTVPRDPERPPASSTTAPRPSEAPAEPPTTTSPETADPPTPTSTTILPDD